MLDPVGWSNSTYGEITYEFKYTGDNVRPEVILYAKFVINWIAERGNRLDVIVNLHNIECDKDLNILCPILEGNQVEEIDNLNNFILTNIERLDPLIKLDNNYWINGGFSKDRFAGW